MEAFIFALFMLLAPNPYDDGKPYRVPLWMGMAAYHEAEKWEHTEPEDIAAVMLAEHGGKAKSPKNGRDPYPMDSVGKDGELGLFQLMAQEVREYNAVMGTSYKHEDVLDGRTAFTVVAYTIHHMKEKHGVKRRCTKKVRDSFAVEVEGGYMAVHTTEPRKQFHTWHAHYRCAPKARDRVVVCKEGQRCPEKKTIEGYKVRPVCLTAWRSRLVVRLSGWREYVPWTLPEAQTVLSGLSDKHEQSDMETADKGDRQNASQDQTSGKSVESSGDGR